MVSLYLEDRTFAFAFPTADKFSGVRVQCFFAVGTTPTIFCGKASPTVTTRNPLKQTTRILELEYSYPFRPMLINPYLTT